jgi:hypothetical protein
MEYLQAMNRASLGERTCEMQPARSQGRVPKLFGILILPPHPGSRHGATGVSVCPAGFFLALFHSFFLYFHSFLLKWYVYSLILCVRRIYVSNFTKAQN